MTDIARIVDPPPGTSRAPISYGDTQEEAAQALNRLIVFDDPPTEPPDVTAMLQCREGAISAIHQRLYALGLDRVAQVKSVEVTSMNLTIADFMSRQSTMLGAVVAGLSRLPAHERGRPTDTFGTRHAHATVESWRTAAVSLLAGSHALDTAPEKPWTQDVGAGWYLVRDLAATIEAVVVLDTRLGEIGILNSLPDGKDTITGDEARLVASQCARVATWHATNDAPDRAMPQPTGRTPAVSGPIRLVTQPSDVAPAQRQLARYMRGLGPSEVLGDWGEPLSAAVARMVVASQLLVATYGEVLTNRCPRPDVAAIGDSFRDRKQVLQAVQTSMANLVDHEPVRDDKRVPWQQGEITTAIRRLERARHPATMSAEQLLDLACATHEVTRVAAKSFRSELFRASGNLRLRDPSGDVGHTRIPNDHPLEAALMDLHNLPAPTTPVSRYQAPLHRAALRATLELTPTGARAPNPLPNPRRLDRGAPAW